jgi:hypothetical protein
MITRIVKLHFKEERISDFFELFEDVKYKVVNFPGCIQMTLLQDHAHPNIVFTYSHWEDAAALEHYRLSTTFNGLWSKIKPMFESKAEAWTLHAQFEGTNKSVKSD